jgi:hypothetical protein
MGIIKIYKIRRGLQGVEALTSEEGILLFSGEFWFLRRDPMGLQ